MRLEIGTQDLDFTLSDTAGRTMKPEAVSVP